MLKKGQTIREEAANTITHGLGILFCMVAIPALITYAAEKNNVVNFWAVAIFCFGMLIVYMSATLFHAIQHPGAKRILQIWDHISIFLLIAG